MLGIPLLPASEVPTAAPVVFLAYQALHDPMLVDKIKTLNESKTPITMTSNLAEQIKDKVDLSGDNINILQIGEKPRELYDIHFDMVKDIRTHLLTPLGLTLDGPTFVAIYPFGDDLMVVENFNDEEVFMKVGIAGSSDHEIVLTIPREMQPEIKGDGEMFSLKLPARSLAVVKYTAAK